MKSLERRYAVTLPGPIGGHGPPAVVVVRATAAVGPGGGPVWTNRDGDFQVEITGEVATVLAAPVGTPHHPCLHAVPLPDRAVPPSDRSVPASDRALPASEHAVPTP